MLRKKTSKEEMIETLNLYKDKQIKDILIVIKIKDLAHTIIKIKMINITIILNNNKIKMINITNSIVGTLILNNNNIEDKIIFTVVIE